MKLYRILCTMIIIGTMLISGKSGSDAQETVITVFAASSLTDALTDVADAFEDRHDVAVVFSFAGSSTLAAQIREGAVADIFASANMTQMQQIIDEGLIDADDVRIFAENQPVIIVPADNPADINSAEDLAEAGHLIVMASETVPIRVYTNELLDLLGDVFAAGYVDDVLANVVSEEPNVRQVVARIVLGEADAAIVYRTDVTPDIADAVTIIELPEGVKSPLAQYPIARLIDAPDPDEADLFIDFVMSDEGQAILQEWNFCSVQVEGDAAIMPEATAEATPEVEIEERFCA